MSAADMPFKLGDISLKSPSTFLSGGEFLQVRSAHPITAWPSQTGRGKREYCDFIIYLSLQGLVTFVIHLVVALFFLRPLPQKAVSPNQTVCEPLGRDRASLTASREPAVVLLIKP